MRRTIAAAAATVVLCGLFSPAVLPAAAATSRPPSKVSPPGQVSIATANARQNKILGLKRFQALLELSKAFRFRPPAFNGGARGAVFAPDIAVISEFRETNVEVFDRLMRQKFDEPYEIVGPSNVQAAFIVNTRTLELQGEVQIVNDVCLNDETSDKPRMHREYPMAQFRELSTGARFTIVGVHLARNYSSSGEADCLARNIREIRAALEHEPGATFIAGDFNFRATASPYECDPNELGDPTHWWSVMTSNGGEGRAYLDAVQSFHRARSRPMSDQWTYLHPKKVIACNGEETVRRSRIDYLFSSGAVVAEAHADDPGWMDPANYKYSDHRYVLGRFVLSGPPRVARPAAVQQVGGVIEVTWQPVEGVAEWIVYRAKPGAQYAQVATLAPETMAYVDSNTVHDRTYRYAIAAAGIDGGHGVESAPVWQAADARGPRVSSVVPPRGAEGVRPWTTIKVTFDEWVDASSVGDNTISLYRSGNRVAGVAERKGGFVLKFNPARPLKKGSGYTIVVRPVTDELGNFGSTFRSRFYTVDPPRKKRR